MKSVKFATTAENAGIDPSTVKMKNWYLEPTCENDDLHFSFSSSVNDASTGGDRTSYQVRGSVANGKTESLKRVLALSAFDHTGSLRTRRSTFFPDAD